MKTAMQELLDWVKEFEDKPVKPTLTNVKEKIWQLLPKETDQLIDFAEYCFMNSDYTTSFEDCFNKRFTK